MFWFLGPGCKNITISTNKEIGCGFISLSWANNKLKNEKKLEEKSSKLKTYPYCDRHFRSQQCFRRSSKGSNAWAWSREKLFLEVENLLMQILWQTILFSISMSVMKREFFFLDKCCHEVKLGTKEVNSGISIDKCWWILDIFFGQLCDSGVFCCSGGRFVFAILWCYFHAFKAVGVWIARP